MPYIRVSFTVFLSFMWFMGALPAPAAQHTAGYRAPAVHQPLRR